MPADARREPLPDAGHGPGRPPDGPLEEGSWASARGLRSMFGWPQHNAAPALPPLTASGLRAHREYGSLDGGVHRLAVPYYILVLQYRNRTLCSAVSVQRRFSYGSAV